MPCKVLRHCPLLTSHKRTVWSSLPLARVFPSGLKATDSNSIGMTLQGVEALAAAHLPQAHCLIFTPAGKDFPSGLKATDQTQSE